MCPTVCLKMEQLAKAKYTHVIKHLAVVIGWSAGDSADYLASTDAGCRYSQGGVAIADSDVHSRSLSC